jgi:hypothetical protein
MDNERQAIGTKEQLREALASGLQEKKPQLDAETQEAMQIYADHLAKNQPQQGGPLEIRQVPMEADVTDVDTAGMNMAINHCYCCQGPHQGVKLNEYRTPQPPFTHWYICPKTGDPTGITIKNRAGTNLEVNANVLKHLVVAQQSESWMTVVWWVEEGKLRSFRQTNEFPTVYFKDAVTDLDADLQGEIGPPKKEEMPVAAAPTPASLFGSAPGHE